VLVKGAEKEIHECASPIQQKLIGEVREEPIYKDLWALNFPNTKFNPPPSMTPTALLSRPVTLMSGIYRFREFY
jgi:hypothetical protein